MGVVYEAEQQNPQRIVALKVIHSTVHLDQYFNRLFRREVQVLARLKHPFSASTRHPHRNRCRSRDFEHSANVESNTRRVYRICAECGLTRLDVGNLIEA
jgi:serine/threonine protein kinase